MNILIYWLITSFCTGDVASVFGYDINVVWLRPVDEGTPHRRFSLLSFPVSGGLAGRHLGPIPV